MISPIMIWHLNYRIDRDFHRHNFWENYHLKETHPKLPEWERVFENVCAELDVYQLGLEGLNVFPRYSYQPAGVGLPPHVDEDEIIGINFSLMDHPVDIIMDGITHSYDAAVVDVGHVVHSVSPADYDRLILKLAIRAPLEEVLERVKDCL